MVQLGMFFWPLEQGAEALRLGRDIVRTMPADVNAIVGAVNAPPAPFVPEQHHFAPGYVLLLTGFDSAAHPQIVADIQRRLPPLFDLVTPIPYVQLQQLLDEANAWGSYAYEKGTYVADLSDEVVDILAAHVPAKTSPMSLLLLYRLDGAYAEVSDDATAFSGGRSPRFDVFIIGVTPDEAGLAIERRWVADLWNALRPYAIANGDGYVNGTSDLEADRVRGSYGPRKYERLARIKAEYDPDNVFHVNANIVPAGR